MLTGDSDLVQSHHRLLRSLSFGDDDYEGHVLSVLKTMVDNDPANLDIINTYVNSKIPEEEGENMSSHDLPGRKLFFNPTVFSVTDEVVDYQLISVMMPFDGKFKGAYEAIQAAAADVNLKCQRADDIWNHSVVIQDIFSLILRSFIVVCDFTERNPNVFYEAGIAHTLGKHVVPLTQSNDDIPFDFGIIDI